MRISILKFVFFSIIICSFEYAKNELYFINKRNVYHERNITNFRNNRILADADNQFDLNDFYQSTLSLANQFNEYDDYVDDEEMSFIRNAIDSHIKKHIKSNTLPDLNNVDKKTKKLINELRTELKELKKDLDNKTNSEMGIQPIQDKRITKKYGNISVSEHEDFKQLENEGNFLESEDDNFEDEYNKIKSKDNFKKLKANKYIKKDEEKTLRYMILMATTLVLVTMVSGTVQLLLLFGPLGFLMYKKWRKIRKCSFKLSKI
ncbi:fam-b protein [Plasmodium yoelii]|uniref:Fam-b protein n=2 Tax=Plasmodium yoelii TaxID=5861 RepID=A0AAE9WYU5_PLAYO|nr:fam-b protein [Plasmodium yoelii]WBY58982.1 fam-b protein [Plasmodium yoelii yoelii]VTZ79814.1 fam-b protein [Plasmodium yoelii]|eukprot:XP_022812535.1 fam-b protein [Plasmodium yoelii]